MLDLVKGEVARASLILCTAWSYENYACLEIIGSQIPCQYCYRQLCSSPLLSTLVNISTCAHSPQRSRRFFGHVCAVNCHRFGRLLPFSTNNGPSRPRVTWQQRRLSTVHSKGRMTSLRQKCQTLESTKAAEGRTRTWCFSTLWWAQWAC